MFCLRRSARRKLAILDFAVRIPVKSSQYVTIPRCTQQGEAKSNIWTDPRLHDWTWNTIQALLQSFLLWSDLTFYGHSSRVMCFPPWQWKEFSFLSKRPFEEKPVSSPVLPGWMLCVNRERKAATGPMINPRWNLISCPGRLEQPESSLSPCLLWFHSLWTLLSPGIGVDAATAAVRSWAELIRGSVVRAGSVLSRQGGNVGLVFRFSQDSGINWL